MIPCGAARSGPGADAEASGALPAGGPAAGGASLTGASFVGGGSSGWKSGRSCPSGVNIRRSTTRIGLFSSVTGFANFTSPRGHHARTKAADGLRIAAVSEALDRLVALVARLRRDCPWDREQTFETLKSYLLEETYETLAAVDEGAPEPLEGELGDLLFQVLLLTRLAEEKGWFGIEAVRERNTTKMCRGI